MRTRNKKNNLSQSKTNNDINHTNKNDINVYLNKYIFNKKKTRNRNENGLLNKKTFNLSSQKSDISGSMYPSNNTFLNKKNINFSKNFFMRSRNKVPSCFKGRPNTIFNKKNQLLVNNIQSQKKASKDQKEINSNLKIKVKNYSMVGYNNVININLNNLSNQNLTERENYINSNIIKSNKSPASNIKRTTRHNKVLSGIYINLSNLDHISKKEINSERNNKIDKNFIKNLSQNKSGNILKENRIYKTKLSLMSSQSVSKSKSKSKSKGKIKISYPKMAKNRTKSNFTNSLKSALIDDITKMKKNIKIQKNIFENKNNKKLINKITNIQKKAKNKNQKNINNSNYINDNIIILNNNDQSSGAMTSRTRNLKTYNIFFKTNSLDIDKNKINEFSNNINNKENYSINRKINNNYMNNSNYNYRNNNNLNNNYYLKCKRNSFGNNLGNKTNYVKKFEKKSISKNNTEKALLDNNLFMPNGLYKVNKTNKKILKNK